MKFQYYAKSVYGVEKFYPVGNQFLEFVGTFGQKTITPNIFYALKVLGHEAEMVIDPELVSKVR